MDKCKKCNWSESALTVFGVCHDVAECQARERIALSWALSEQIYLNVELRGLLKACELWLSGCAQMLEDMGDASGAVDKLRDLHARITAKLKEGDDG